MSKSDFSQTLQQINKKLDTIDVRLQDLELKGKNRNAMVQEICDHLISYSSKADEIIDLLTDINDNLTPPERE